MWFLLAGIVYLAYSRSHSRTGAPLITGRSVGGCGDQARARLAAAERTRNGG